MRTTLIRNARAVVTCDAQDRVFWDADILIQGPKIVKIGKDLPDPCDEVIDAAGMFVYPGLINTHHHFFQACVARALANAVDGAFNLGGAGRYRRQRVCRRQAQIVMAVHRNHHIFHTLHMLF